MAHARREAGGLNEFGCVPRGPIFMIRWRASQPIGQRCREQRLPFVDVAVDQRRDLSDLPGRRVLDEFIVLIHRGDLTLPTGGRNDAVEPHAVSKLHDHPGQERVLGALDQCEVKGAIGVNVGENVIGAHRLCNDVGERPQLVNIGQPALGEHHRREALEQRAHCE